MSIASDVQKLEQDAIISMFEIDARSVSQGLLRFTNEAVTEGSILFGGYEYISLPISATGFEYAGKGQLPRPTLNVSALSISFLSLVIGADDLVGLPIRRIRTYRKHLDDGSDPDSQAIFPVDHYVFERKSRHNPSSGQLEFELATEMDQEGRKIPARQILRDSCTHIYRRWTGSGFDYMNATCPYAGSQSYDAAGNPVSNSEDVCGKRLGDCKLRFGENGRLPTRAFPGVGRVR